MSCSLGDLTFETKQMVAKHASTVLNRAGLGEVLAGGDEAFARALLAHHPEAALKLGLGVRAITVVLIPEWGTRNFLILREDGSVDNWSVKKCINMLRPTGRATERN